MKSIIVVIVILVILGVGYYFLYGKNGIYSNMQNTNPSTDSTTPVVQNTVEAKNLAFTPSIIKVNVGDTVTFTNNDTTTHTVTSSTFDSGELAEGQSFKRTFDTAGTYDYHCSLHPFMTGQVIVQ